MTISTSPAAVCATSNLSLNKSNTKNNIINDLEISDIYSQLVRHQFTIKNPNDIASLFPNNIEHIEMGFYSTKNNVLACLEKIVSISPEHRNFENTIRPLSKFALLIKTVNFCADLSANFEDISEDMAKKLDVKDAKKGYFNEKANFERGLFLNMIKFQLISAYRELF